MDITPLLKKPSELNKKIRFYIHKHSLTKPTITLRKIQGHVEKAEHNLKFVKGAIGIGFLDWAIVGCYYSIYHVALALIMKRGYFSNNHEATICILIREYYQQSLSCGDIQLVAGAYLDTRDILFYAHSRDERQRASYSTNISFDLGEVTELCERTQLFVRKAEEILEGL